MGPSRVDLHVHAARQFQEIIRKERARADRTGGAFALVSLELRALAAGRPELQRLVRALRQRIRATDVLGWLDEQTLSVLLPGADAKGMRAFAADLARQYAGQGAPLPFTEYCYPDHWLVAGDGGGAQGGGSGAHAAFRRVERRLEATVAGNVPAWKRALDIAGALLGLLAAAPLFVALAAYIRIVSPGPVFFRQQRLGYRARPFTFLKFRTMRADNDAGCHQDHLRQLIGSDRPMEKLDEGRDPRIIPGGRVLRKLCVDELPQLVNVLRGEMSLVGPRPCLPYEAREYLRWHGHRFDVLPGLTGLWQVSGKNRLTFKEMIRLDISYCRRLSPWLDLLILLRTVPTVAGLFCEGVANRLGRSFPRRRSLP